MMTNKKMEDVIRTVGQLLLHRPTTGWAAKDKNGYWTGSTNSQATCFCYVGAVHAVSSKFHMKFTDVYHEVNAFLGWELDVENWDKSDDTWRQNVASTLCGYPDPACPDVWKRIEELNV